MNRYEQWDIVSSVGLTALVVAAGRSVDTHRADGLISDPYAERFVAAAAPPHPLPTRPTPPRDDSDDELWQMMSGYMGVRTRFFDEFFAAAGRDGVRQAVILAAGLDARAQRLAWAEGTTLWEIDQPAVLAFKDDVLAEDGAAARCDRRTVAVDLRDDWPAALDRAGLDPTAPTAWLAEGLLPYLPAEAQEALLAAVHERSAAGSRIAVEDFTDIGRQLEDPAFRRVAAGIGVDMPALLHTDDRPDPGDRLAALGWTVRRDVAVDVAAGWGRELDPLTRRLNGRSAFVTATR
ncbi:SAM-dependent methyltransferase [Actinomycetospora lemnae]|uniref:S-adenosyl-L-methionine-dependent methyltransferase n=1 Tax=Actinomycetospora lemnae TaxID=3019891 RepID=A0ABT5SWN0_9PSEU|nr:SAM-dependent methyltransferase [Actinomycetospora sp. DW7H6]MDD7966875.1 SAM-dependent methyltransferase [Actinomycetospora sp. DW7H6]